MKKLAGTALFLAILSLITSLYIQFVLVPEKNAAYFILDNRPNTGDDDFSYYDSSEYQNALRVIESTGDLMDYIGIFSIVVAALCCILIVIIRNTKSYIALGLSLSALLIFLIHGTHMFS